jgi:molybdopterin converting factor small subunit
MQESTNHSHSTTARITWNIPSIFRQHTGGNSDVELEVADASFQTALKSLLAMYPGLAEHFDPDSRKPQSYISMFHNDLQITDLESDISLKDHDELLIVAALAGG